MARRQLTRRTFLRTLVASATLTTVGGVGTGYYARHIEPERIEISEISLTLPRLDPAFNGYRLTHISDLHIDDTWMDETRLSAVVELVNQQQADLIAITGDFITRDSRRFAAMARRALRPLTAPDGVVAVLGNHDHWWYPEVVSEILDTLGMRELADTFHTIRRGAAQLQLVGMDDLWQDPQRRYTVWDHEERFGQVLAQVPAEGAAILLVHEPDFADVSAPADRFDLQLSGHAHGGQVQMPGHGPLELPTMGKIYPAGLYQVGSLIQYTSRGLGTVTPQVRLFCRPQITVFTLQAA